MLSTLDAYLLDLAASEGLVDVVTHSAWPIVEQRQTIANSLSRQLQTLGLHRQQPVDEDLNDILARESR